MADSKLTSAAVADKPLPEIRCAVCKKVIPPDAEPYAMAGAPVDADHPIPFDAWCSRDCWMIETDPQDDDGPEPGEECGRWSNGRLTAHCSKAGSDECDWECPYGR
jgi:hypothetical protein